MPCTYCLKKMKVLEVHAVKNQKVRIGAAPDFVVHIGKELCFHTFAITLSVNGLRPYRRIISHQSLKQIVCELKEVLKVIELRDESDIIWLPENPQSGEVVTKKGVAAFVYTCSGRLPREIIASLSASFQRLLTED